MGAMQALLRKRKPVGGRLFSCLGLGGFLADDRRCGPKKQGDQDGIGKGLYGRVISD